MNNQGSSPAENNDTLLQTLHALYGDNAEALKEDLSMIRVIEDVVDLLVLKGLIRVTDLPEAVQAKLMQRRARRDGGGFQPDGADMIDL